MTIAQALKEKNKKVTKLSNLWDRLQRYNVVTEGDTRPYSSQDTWNEIEKLTKEIVELKTRIHHASEPVRLDIFMLSELKNKAQRLKSVNTNSGTYRDRYSDSAPVVQTPEFDILWKDSMVEQIETQIEETQERLDKFNHTSNI
jgi:DNA repair exonuclease SbcCD ATPase subunit